VLVGEERVAVQAAGKPQAFSEQGNRNSEFDLEVRRLSPLVREGAGRGHLAAV
jgi:hypothetical protein